MKYQVYKYHVEYTERVSGVSKYRADEKINIIASSFENADETLNRILKEKGNPYGVHFLERSVASGDIHLVSDEFLKWVETEWLDGLIERENVKIAEKKEKIKNDLDGFKK
jgi:hypothetical protein